MAVRLSVIMVHSPPAVASAQRMAESIVGELIGRSGIDLTLVGPFSQLSEQSTDRLTLASLAGDVAVLDWQSPAEILKSLEQLDFQGERSPHPHDPNVTPSVAAETQRRVYALDLNGFSQPEEVIDALNHLREHRQVRTFSLGPLPQQVGRTIPIVSAAGTKDNKTKTKTIPPINPDPPRESESDGQPEPLDLDQLLDDLDQLDP